jgi:hypothetical protein
MSFKIIGTRLSTPSDLGFPKGVFFGHFKKGDKGIYVLIDGTIHQ